MAVDDPLQEKAIDAGLRAWFHRSRWGYVEVNKETLRKDFARAVRAYLDVINKVER
jgi:hypothetical protein